MKHAPALIVLLALSACGGDRPAENAADPLNEAAEQGTPTTAEPSENTADRIVEDNVQNPDSAAGPPAGTSQPVDDLANSY